MLPCVTMAGDTQGPFVHFQKIWSPLNGRLGYLKNRTTVKGLCVMRRMGSSKPINFGKVSTVFLFFGALLILQGKQ